MEISREIYWNVGHGPWTLIPMYFLALTALSLMVLGFLKRLEIYRQGKDINRFDSTLTRSMHAIKLILTQARVIREPGSGFLHSFFFWGFFLLFIGTVLIVIQADFTDLLFDYKFLTGNFYKAFSLILDISGLIALVMLLGLLTRRYIIRPKGLETRIDDAVMHSLMLLILATGFLIEGSRMAVTEAGSALAPWSPVGNVIAMMLLDVNQETLLKLHRITWWFHLILVMGFIAIIPQIKFRHIFTTSCNYFFSDLGPKGKLEALDMEDEEAESFGASTVAELRWKDIFDSDACTLCKRCQDRCPAYATDKPLSPMRIVNTIGELAANKPHENIIGEISKDALWSCTTCFACQDACPAMIEHPAKIIEMRRNLVLMEGEFPGEEVTSAMEQTEVNGNPLGIGYASRADWADGLEIETLSENSDIDVLYFVGCYGSFDKRNIKAAKHFINLCGKAGIRLGILGKEEKCCGEPMRKMGNEYLYYGLASENVEIIKSYGINTIVTACPHCFNTLNKDYRDLGLEAEVVQSTVFLERLVNEGLLQFSQEPFSCTFHDSCYLGRHNDIYDAPRNLITACGGEIVEMKNSKENSFCCSAGGGRILAEENIGERINIKRVRMAAETGAGTLVSSCPFCLTMFEDGIKGADLDGSIKSLDILEILEQRVIT